MLAVQFSSTPYLVLTFFGGLLTGGLWKPPTDPPKPDPETITNCTLRLEEQIELALREERKQVTGTVPWWLLVLMLVLLVTAVASYVRERRRGNRLLAQQLRAARTRARTLRR